MVTNSSLTLIKPQPYEFLKIRLSSPLLHIGAAISQLSPFEYVQTSERVYLADADRLARELLRSGKLQDYLGAIEDNKPIENLVRQSFGEDWINQKDSEGCPIFPKQLSSSKWTQDSIDAKKSILRPMIRNGMGEFFIPGSSIKGAIRTAIAYYLLRHATNYNTPKRVSEIEKKLRDKLQIGALKKEAKSVDDNLLMDSLFSDFSLNYQGYSPQINSKPNTDFMRSLKIADSSPLHHKELRSKSGKTKWSNNSTVAEVIISSYFEDNKAKYRASIYAEMVHEVRTEFTITLDSKMLETFTHNQEMSFPFNNLEDILNICQEFAQEQWDEEHDYWQMIQNNSSKEKNLNFDLVRDFYEAEKCPYHLRLGWGSGLNGTTIGLLLNKELRRDIRDACGIKAPNFEAPKSRRTVVDRQGNIQFTLGWVKFEVLP